MKVSVLIITYNHAPFIRQAIDSVLMQKTNFDFEILLGEDDSTDGTRQIVQEYHARHPDKIRLFLHDRKNVIYINGQPTGRANLAHSFKNARGQYIARLDGDDYWTSPDKLQKQVDYLDKNPHITFCFHDVQVVYEDGSPSHPFRFRSRNPVYTLAELLERKTNPQTCSVMFRNRFFKEFPDWFYRAPAADLPLYVLHSEHGDFGFIDENMGVYRIHPGGIWSRGDNAGHSWSSDMKRKRYASMLQTYEDINAHLGYKFDRIIRKKIAEHCYDLTWLYQSESDFSQMRSYLWKALKNCVLPPKVLRSYACKAWLIALFPQLYLAFASQKPPKCSQTAADSSDPAV